MQVLFECKVGTQHLRITELFVHNVDCRIRHGSTARLLAKSRCLVVIQSITALCHAGIREAVGNPYKRDFARKQSHSATQNRLRIAAICHSPAETHTRRQNDIGTRFAIGTNAVFHGYFARIKLGILARSVENHRNIYTQAVCEFQIAHHLPLLLGIKTELRHRGTDSRIADRVVTQIGR